MIDWNGVKKRLELLTELVGVFYLLQLLLGVRIWRGRVDWRGLCSC